MHINRSWMVKDIASQPEGWPKNTADLEAVCKAAWDRISLESIRKLMLGYRQRIQCIVSNNGDRHPQFS